MVIGLSVVISGVGDSLCRYTLRLFEVRVVLYVVVASIHWSYHVGLSAIGIEAMVLLYAVFIGGLIHCVYASWVSSSVVEHTKGEYMCSLLRVRVM